MKKRRTSTKLTTVILIVILVAGLSLLLYPTVSEYWNSLHQTRLIMDYSGAVAAMEDDEYESLWNAAVAYNKKLAAQGGFLHTLTDEEQEEYESLLNVYGNGMMSYIEIPSISCSLPIYHGTSDAVLQTAVGHLESSSLPVGGESTHCVISGHRGLPSAKLFSNLDQLEEGDTFILYTLDEVLTYEVDQIRIVLPDEVSDLAIVEGKDLCTLVTCTPYGVNTHRLLIRGHRIPNDSEVRVTADAMQIDAKIVAPFVAIPILLILFIYLIISTRPTREEKERRKKELLREKEEAIRKKLEKKAARHG